MPMTIALCAGQCVPALLLREPRVRYCSNPRLATNATERVRHAGVAQLLVGTPQAAVCSGTTGSFWLHEPWRDNRESRVPQRVPAFLVVIYRGTMAIMDIWSLCCAKKAFCWELLRSNSFCDTSTSQFNVIQQIAHSYLEVSHLNATR